MPCTCAKIITWGGDTPPERVQEFTHGPLVTSLSQAFKPSWSHRRIPTDSAPIWSGSSFWFIPLLPFIALAEVEEKLICVRERH